VVLDKVDLLQAMNFKEQLTEIGLSLREKVNGKVIITTTVKNAKDSSIDEQNDFAEIKAAFMGN